MLSAASQLRLNDGHSIPQLGFGVTPYESTLTALTQASFRHIDCAVLYQSEAEVGEAIRRSGLKRSEVFVTTKLQKPPKDGDVLGAVRASVARFGFEYVDCFLVHDPSIGKDARLAIWKALIQLKREGKTRSIGVSNYNIHHLKELEEASDETPAVNQIELHPWCQHPEVVDYCRHKGIAIEAYCPLAMGKKWQDPTLQRIAKAHNCDPAKVLLRWSLQRGFVCLTKSDTPSRIVSNAQLFDGFELSASELEDLNALDRGEWFCWDVINSP